MKSARHRGRTRDVLREGVRLSETDRDVVLPVNDGKGTRVWRVAWGVSMHEGQGVAWRQRGPASRIHPA